MRIRVNRDPRFCTVVVVTAFSPEDQPCLVYGVRTWALAGRFARLPAGHFAAVERSASISCAMVTSFLSQFAFTVSRGGFELIKPIVVLFITY